MTEYIVKIEKEINCCNECPLFDSCSIVKKWLESTRVTEESVYNDRLNGCTLRKLPPHGRCIDADECGKVLLDKYTEGLGKWDELYSAGYRYALKYFSQAPTVLEASTEETV